MPEQVNFFKNFKRQKFQDRTDVVSLKKFGDTADTLDWHIRGLNAVDLERVDTAEQENSSVNKLMEIALKAAGNDEKSKSELMDKMFGLSDDVPGSLVRKYVIFELGSIAPNKPANRQDVIKFASAYPIEFRNIVNNISSLTGLGAMAKKKPLPDTESLETT